MLLRCPQSLSQPSWTCDGYGVGVPVPVPVAVPVPFGLGVGLGDGFSWKYVKMATTEATIPRIRPTRVSILSPLFRMLTPSGRHRFGAYLLAAHVLLPKRKLALRLLRVSTPTYWPLMSCYRNVC